VRDPVWQLFGARRQTGEEHNERYIILHISSILLKIFSWLFYYLQLKSFQMDLQKKFQEATSSLAIKVNSMEVNKQYPFVSAERFNYKVRT
jgi:hypothetical protein